jgi:hypothetical protein
VKRAENEGLFDPGFSIFERVLSSEKQDDAEPFSSKVLLS